MVGRNTPTSRVLGRIDAMSRVVSRIAMMILWCRQHAWLDVGGPEVTNGPAEVFRPEAGGTPSERWGGTRFEPHERKRQRRLATSGRRDLRLLKFYASNPP